MRALDKGGGGLSVGAATERSDYELYRSDTNTIENRKEYERAHVQCNWPIASSH
jgi:hypothetical protein